MLPHCIFTSYDFSNVQAKSVLYADDTIFLTSSKDLSEATKFSSVALDNVMNWFNSNSFKTNKDKPHSLISSLKKLVLTDSSESLNFLGMYIDTKLNWHIHIQFLCKKKLEFFLLIQL